MGLMLGLNILDVLVFSGSVLKLIAKKIRKGLKCLVQTVRGRGSEAFKRSKRLSTWFDPKKTKKMDAP